MHRADYAIPAALGLILGGCGPFGGQETPTPQVSPGNPTFTPTQTPSDSAGEMCLPDGETSSDYNDCSEASPTPEYGYGNPQPGSKGMTSGLSCPLPEGSCCPEAGAATTHPMAGDWRISDGMATYFGGLNRGEVQSSTSSISGRMSLGDSLHGCAPMVIKHSSVNGPYNCSESCTSYDFSVAMEEIEAEKTYRIRLLEERGSLDLNCTMEGSILDCIEEGGHEETFSVSFARQ